MFLKLSKAARILDVHRSTMLRYIRQGLIKGQQLPTGHWRIDENSVNALLNTGIEEKVDDILKSLWP